MVFEDVDDELIQNIKLLAKSTFHTEDIESSAASVTFGNYEISFAWQKIF